MSASCQEFVSFEEAVVAPSPSQPVWPTPITTSAPSARSSSTLAWALAMEPRPSTSTSMAPPLVVRPKRPTTVPVPVSKVVVWG